jgi:hypothetical protein
MQEPLSDNQAHDLLDAAERALGDAPGKTIHANTALQAARKMLSLLKTCLVIAGVRAEKD